MPEQLKEIVLREWERQGWPLADLLAFKMKDDDDDDGDDGDDDLDADGKKKRRNPEDEPVTMSQYELTRYLAREKRDGKASALREFADELGLKNPEDIKRIVEEAQVENDKKKSDADRATEAAKRREEEADNREAKAWKRELSALVRGALLDAGMDRSEIDEDVIGMVKTGYDVGDEIDEEAVTDAVEALKERRPRLFEEPDDTPENKNGSSTPGQKLPKAPGKKVKSDPEKEAHDILMKRHGATLARNS